MRKLLLTRIKTPRKKQMMLREVTILVSGKRKISGN